MFDYDGKRDRWNGYNPEEHMKIVEEYAKVDLVSKIPCFPPILKECTFCSVSNLATQFFESSSSLKMVDFLLSE